MSNKKYYVRFRFEKDEYPVWMYSSKSSYVSSEGDIKLEDLSPKSLIGAYRLLQYILVEFKANNDEIEEFIEELWDREYCSHAFKCENADFPKAYVEAELTDDPYDWDEVETGDTSIRESKIIFDSILNEEAGRTTPSIIKPCK